MIWKKIVIEQLWYWKNYFTVYTHILSQISKRQIIRQPLHSCISETLNQHSEHPPTCTSRGLHTKYLKCSGKTLYQKKCKFEELLFVWFRWNVQVVLFFARDCCALWLCLLPWEAISLYIRNEIDWCMWQTLHICPTTSYFSRAAVWNKNEILKNSIFLIIERLLPNMDISVLKRTNAPILRTSFSNSLWGKRWTQNCKLTLRSVKYNYKNIVLAYFLKISSAYNKQTKISLATRKTTFWLNMNHHGYKTTFWISWSRCIFNNTNLEEISEENWMHILNQWNSYEHLKTCSHFETLVSKGLNNL